MKLQLRGITSKCIRLNRNGISKTNGFVNGRGKTNGAGSVNGLVNGCGRINGTGRINGIGRINGMGRTNGLVNGTGRINGMGKVNGIGRINGTSKGFGRVNGLVNGFRGKKSNSYEIVEVTHSRYYKKRYRYMKAYQAFTVISIFFILIAIPFVATYAIHSFERISIDGIFDDWKNSGARLFTSSNYFASQPAKENPHIAISQYAIDYYSGLRKISAYVKTDGTILQGDGKYLDKINVFIDTDSSNLTGYRIKGIGADERIEIGGNNQSIFTGLLYQYSGTGRDWQWTQENIGVQASLNKDQIEFSASIYELGKTDFKWLVATQDGNYDMAITPVHDSTGKEVRAHSTISSKAGIISIDGKFDDWTNITGTTHSNPDRIGIKEIKDMEWNSNTSVYVKTTGVIFTGIMPDKVTYVGKTATGNQSSSSSPTKTIENPVDANNEGNDTIIIAINQTLRAIYKGIYDDIYQSELQIWNGTWNKVCELASASNGSQFETNLPITGIKSLNVSTSDWLGKYDFVIKNTQTQAFSAIREQVTPQVAVDTSTSAVSCAWSSQRKCFRDTNGYYWATYIYNTYPVVERSDDTAGTAWTGYKYIMGTGATSEPSLWYAGGATVWFAFFANTYDIYVRSATLSGNPTTLAFNANSTAMDGTAASNIYSRPFITLDSSGYVWVSAKHYTTTYHVQVTRSTNVGNNPAAWAAPATISATTASAFVFTVILPLATQNMYMIAKLGTAYVGRAYTSGAWAGSDTAIATSTAVNTRSISAVVNSQYHINLVYIDASGYLRSMKYTGSWGAAVAIDVSVATCTYPTITINPTGDALAVFYMRAANSIYWSYSNDRGATWNAVASLVTGLTSPIYLSSVYSSTTDSAMYIYQTAAASPYTINAQYQTIAEAQDYVYSALIFMPCIAVILIARRKAKK